jgi:hypothetical protein
MVDRLAKTGLEAADVVDPTDRSILLKDRFQTVTITVTNLGRTCQPGLVSNRARATISRMAGSASDPN